MKKDKMLTLFLAGAISATSASCGTDATPEELEQMCQRLVLLRREQNTPAAQKKCLAEAQSQGISQKQAQCRISAANLQEYWIRCRTGAARAPKPK